MKQGVLAAAVVVFAAVAVAVPAAIFRLANAAGEDEVQVPLDVVPPIDRALRRLSETPPGRRRVVYLGDSMVVSYGLTRAAPQRLQALLDRGPTAGRFRIQAVAAPGMGPFDFYFIADRVSAARPDEVILPVNLTSFSRSWRETFSRTELAGLLPPGRVPRALALPLDSIGMTADRLLGYVGIVQLGALDPWHWLSRNQARVGSVRTQLVRWLSQRFAGDADSRFALDAVAHFIAKYDLPDLPRLTPAAIEDRYGPVLRGLDPDDPGLRMLAATIRILRDAGIEVLVYVSPTNVEHFERVGAADPAGLARSIAAIEAVATDAGARFLDLHDRIGDEGFRDGAGHLSREAGEGRVDGVKLLVESLAPPLVAHARPAGARD